MGVLHFVPQMNPFGVGPLADSFFVGQSARSHLFAYLLYKLF